MADVVPARLGNRKLGEGPGMPLVLVHGFGGRVESWELFQTRMARHGPTIAFDLPGHGRSLDYPGFGPPNVAARAIIDELNMMGHEKVHLLGHSMGGAVSSLIALFRPELVASMTLLAPGGFGPEINSHMLNRFVEAGSPEELGEVMLAFFAPGIEIEPAIFVLLFQAMQEPGIRAALRRIASEVFKDGAQGVLPLKDIGRLGMPIDVVWGEMDTIIPARQAENLPEGFTTHIFPNVGHMPAEEIPDDVERLILARTKAS